MIVLLLIIIGRDGCAIHVGACIICTGTSGLCVHAEYAQEIVDWRRRISAELPEGTGAGGAPLTMRAVYAQL